MSIEESTQHLIQSFLRANLPDFPSFSLDNDSGFDPSTDFGERDDISSRGTSVSLDEILSTKPEQRQERFLFLLILLNKFLIVRIVPL